MIRQRRDRAQAKQALICGYQRQSEHLSRSGEETIGRIFVSKLEFVCSCNNLARQGSFAQSG